MCRLAVDYSGAEASRKRILDWYPQKKYDGIWANASLLYLSLPEIEKFICRISRCLNSGGVFYISMKQGIQTGYDNSGRFFTDFTEDTIREIIMKCKTLEVFDIWNTEDGLGRNDAKWLNECSEKYRKDQLSDTPEETVRDSQTCEPFLNAKKLLLKALDILGFYRYTIHENNMCFQKHMDCKQKHIK